MASLLVRMLGFIVIGLGSGPSDRQADAVPDQTVYQARR